MEFPDRPSWPEYFMSIAHLVASRSTCGRRQVGAVIVKDKNILASGYNGAPPGVSHCEAVGCLRENLNVPSGERHELCRGLHAEQNAIIQAAKHGVCIKGADIYVTLSPCSICSKQLASVEIRRIFYAEGYPEDLGLAILEEAGVEVIKLQEV